MEEILYWHLDTARLWLKEKGIGYTIISDSHITKEDNRMTEYFLIEEGGFITNISPALSFLDEFLLTML